MNTNQTPDRLEFDFPAFPRPTRVNTAVAAMNPLNMRECVLISRRVENGFLTPDEERELAEVYAELAKEELRTEGRCLHPDRKENCRG